MGLIQRLTLEKENSHTMPLLWKSLLTSMLPVPNATYLAYSTYVQYLDLSTGTYLTQMTPFKRKCSSYLWLFSRSDSQGHF